MFAGYRKYGIFRPTHKTNLNTLCTLLLHLVQAKVETRDGNVADGGTFLAAPVWDFDVLRLGLERNSGDWH